MRVHALGQKSLDIAKELSRNHRTMRKFLFDSNAQRTRSDKGKSRNVTLREMTRFKRAADKKPLASSRNIFEQAGVSGVHRVSRSRYLQNIAKVIKSVIQPPLTAKHKSKRLKQTREYLKTDFQNVLITDECRATLNGLDGWSRRWLVNQAKNRQD